MGQRAAKDVPVHVEASCTQSRIYHSGAAAQRIARAIAEEFGAPVAEDAEVIVKARIEDDLCTLSIDSSGESLHKRGHKAGIGKAPLRETLAALFLRQCGFTGDEPRGGPDVRLGHLRHRGGGDRGRPQPGPHPRISPSRSSPPSMRRRGRR